MKIRDLVTLSVVVTTFATAALAADPEEGRQLYENTEFSRVMNGEHRDDVTCADCHTPSFYTRKDRQADSYQRLHFWVNSCDNMLGVGWFPEEVDAVTAYLNREYYHYPQP